MRAAATCITSRSTRKALLQCVARTSRAHGSPVGLDFLRPGCPTISTRYYKTAAKRQNNDARIVRNAQDTIYALSTANGRAGIAIVRISGAACLDIYRALCPKKKDPRPRYATLRSLYNPLSEDDGHSEVLDHDALVLYFPSPNTVTGEDVLELHIHGGPATVKAVLSSIPQCSSQASHVRYAEPGEFTRRAFQNGRLDLAQVEALSDALSAETEQQRRAAVRGNASALGKQYEAWRQQLLGARGELEALIDFSEDHDFSDSDPDMLGNVYEAIKDIRQSIEVHDEAAKRGELLRKGIRISLLGPPNAGKSSLLNRIVGREASIVTPEAGTTRDVIEVSLDIGGYLCTFADTAGLRVAGQGKRSDEIGVVELEGIRRAKEKAKESDMIIVMTSVEKSPDMDEEWHINYDIESLELVSNAGSDGEHCRALVVINKTDSIPPAEFETLHSQFSMFVSMLRHLPQPIAISCLETSAADTKDPGNINALILKLTDSFKSLTIIPDALYGVTERQRQLLQRCDEHLAQYLRETGGKDVDMRNMDFDVVVAAEELREAADALGRLTGRGEASDVNEVLGVVFEKFCVGK